MKKNLKYFLMVLIAMCYSVISARASTECNYGQELTITFDASGSPTINENFWPSYDDKFSWFKKEIIKDTSITAGELEWQQLDLAGLCPSKVYYCKVVKQRINILDSSEKTLQGIKNSITANSSISEVLKALSNNLFSYTEEKAVYLAGSESQLKDEYKIDGSESEIHGYELIDVIIDIKNGKYEPLPAINAILDGVTLDGIYYKKQECGYLDYSGENPTYNLACSNTTTYLQEYTQNISSFKDCSNDAYCKAKELNKAKRVEERIKKYCKNILENYNYEEGSVEADCIGQCLHMDELIDAVNKNAGINKGSIGSCGFSGRLLAWGRNIIKWVKYIIPIVLIVLGILDFIRAITKDKEEEMKKAQDRFIKRLIAAALIFIIPFILGFVLDKMGFGDYIDGCDVIEELNDY